MSNCERSVVILLRNVKLLPVQVQAKYLHQPIAGDCHAAGYNEESAMTNGTKSVCRYWHT
jgi:hypothetical protein